MTMTKALNRRGLTEERFKTVVEATADRLGFMATIDFQTNGINLEEMASGIHFNVIDCAEECYKMIEIELDAIGD